MANLNGFDANTVEPTTEFDPVPAGKYMAVVAASEMKPTKNGKGSYLKARSSEICEMLVKRFDLDLSKKKKRASVKKSDDAEDEE